MKLPDGNRVLQQQITESLICWDLLGKNNPKAIRRPDRRTVVIMLYLPILKSENKGVLGFSE